jgi:hypothetical protein
MLPIRAEHITNKLEEAFFVTFMTSLTFKSERIVKVISWKRHMLLFPNEIAPTIHVISLIMLHSGCGCPGFRRRILNNTGLCATELDY